MLADLFLPILLLLHFTLLFDTPLVLSVLFIFHHDKKLFLQIFPPHKYIFFHFFWAFYLKILALFLSFSISLNGFFVYLFVSMGIFQLQHENY